ncbi:MAG: TlpA family protein disulfide reductase [Candidatus Bathyarchaeota archaeon]|nr:MAG: TlpA family protein disulfide reductase [Candidatus Bathyarchaeota archaeon]
MKRKIILFVFIVIAISSIWYLIQTKEPLDSDFSVTASELTDIEGNTFRLQDFNGKILVLDFMSISCGSCRLQIPFYKQVQDEYGEDVVIIVIDINPHRSEDELKAFAQEFPYARWIWTRDTAGLSRSYQIIEIPTTIILDQKGTTRFIHVGIANAPQIIGNIERIRTK